MKSKLKSLLPSAVPQSLFAITCVLLLIVGAFSWTGINSIGKEADAGMAVFALPEPLGMGQLRHHGNSLAHHPYASSKSANL